MGIQPSASRTGLLLDCPRPFDVEVEIEPDPPREPSRYGSAFHQVLAHWLSQSKGLKPEVHARAIDKAVRQWDVKHTAEELSGHVKSSYKVLRNWIEKEKLRVVEIECAYAVNPSTGKVRPIKPHDEDHRYDVEEGEMPLTLDLRLEDDRRVFFFDHKTGWQDWEGGEFALPKSVAQMRTVGLVGATVPKLERHIGIFHADRRGLPAIYEDDYEDVDAKKHSRALATALTLIGSGFLRPGKQCNRCPARSNCPAKSADLISEATAELVEAANTLADEPVKGQSFAPVPANALVTVERRAAALFELFKKFRPLEKAGMDEIKQLVREGRLIETREGVLVFHTQTYEMVSKKSITEGLGKVAAERLFKKLRDKGAMRDTKREVLVPEKDPS